MENYLFELLYPLLLKSSKFCIVGNPLPGKYSDDFSFSNILSASSYIMKKEKLLMKNR